MWLSLGGPALLLAALSVSKMTTESRTAPYSGGSQIPLAGMEFHYLKCHKHQGQTWHLIRKYVDVTIRTGARWEDASTATRAVNTSGSTPVLISPGTKQNGLMAGVAPHAHCSPAVVPTGQVKHNQTPT